MMNDEVQLRMFDYEQLEMETRVTVRQRTVEIRERTETIKRSYVEIGQKLREVKEQLSHGQFGAWLEAEFEWSQDTAQNLMRVAKMVEDNRKFSDFQPHIAQSAMYLLAAPSTPPEVREEVLVKAEAGERVTHKSVRELANALRPDPDDTGVEHEHAGNIRPLSEMEPEREPITTPPAVAGLTAAAPSGVEPGARPQEESRSLPTLPPPVISEPNWEIKITVRPDKTALISASHGDGMPLMRSAATAADLKRVFNQIVDEHIFVEPLVIEASSGDDLPVAEPEWLS